MSDHEEQQVSTVHIILMKGATAQMRQIAASCDRDTAREIYAELRRLSAELAAQHGFGELKQVGRKAA